MLPMYPGSHATAPLGLHSCRGHERPWRRTAARAHTCAGLWGTGMGVWMGTGTGTCARRGDEGCMGVGIS